ncbi:hypothetical protein LSH36_150g02015 [Paralvinella palmiformis]|uniref:SUEL-type lectin domain-containing protein n=1 Tax=Paralvinella palmiformis TaxID=53620 RepID=A0AAD9JVI2_9ANNE|nr:hypothetical protein LSH36_150g02015 [Paralvinella palmiformis]
MERIKLAMITITLWSSIIQYTQGVINMQGCTEAFFRMTCPDDDILQVYDIRFSEVEPGHPCTQQQPSEAIIPKELTEQCLPNNKTKDGHLMCSYFEEICDGKNQCVFYVSPHLISGRETPTVNSEVIIKYECKPGKKRTAEIGAASFVAVFSIFILLIVGGLLMWREITHNTSDYVVGSSANQPSTTHPSHPSVSSYQHEGQGAAAAAIAEDDISVELSTTSTGISHIQT